MKRSRSSLFRPLLAVVLLALLFGGWGAAGEMAKPAGYPSRPIEIIVPFAPGGGMDISTRILARFAEPELGQKIDVVNHTKGGNLQGNLDGIQSAPDGYGLGSWGMGLVTDELVVENAPYTHYDVLPLCMYANDPHIIAVSAHFAISKNIETLRDLLAYTAANPGQVTFGVGGKRSGVRVARE